MPPTIHRRRGFTGLGHEMEQEKATVPPQPVEESATASYNAKSGKVMFFITSEGSPKMLSVKKAEELQKSLEIALRVAHMNSREVILR